MTIPLASDVCVPLADYLKAETWPLHREAETSGVVADIIRRRVDLSDYSNFVQNLSEVYKTLEGETAWLRQYPDLQVFFTPALYRQTRLEHDYVHLLSSKESMSPATIYPVTQQYCAHIKRSQGHASSAMLAHIYVRYLGDLNGGQVLKRLLKSSLSLPDSCLSFYDFPEIQNIHQFRTSFREALNEITLTEAERDISKQAAMAAFQFNVALSNACKVKLSSN